MRYERGGDQKLGMLIEEYERIEIRKEISGLNNYKLTKSEIYSEILKQVF